MKHPLDLRLLQAFILFVETGSVSETARRIGRSQPAVSLQLRRLEEATQTKLFSPVGRKLVLTSNGELLLGYARTIMSLQNEVKVRLAAPKVSGRVVLGTPDLYASSLLPGVLSAFCSAYPEVQLEIRCLLSSQLMGLLERDQIDLALVTGMPAFRSGQLVAQETLVWVGDEAGSSHSKNPVPIAVLPPGNVFRDVMLAALEKMGRRWKIVCETESIGGLQAAVLGGIAVSAMGRSSLIPGMRQIGRDESFPRLPNVDLVLHRSGRRKNPAADEMGDVIANHLARSSVAPLTHHVTTQAGSGSHD